MAGDPMLAAASVAAARSRLSVRARFPADDRYAQAFGMLRPGAAFVVAEGGVLRGVLLLRDHGRDPYDLAPVLCLYGMLRLLRHRVAEAVSSGPTLHIAAFWTAPDARGQGIGSALLAALPDDALITLLARPGREGFYRRHGFGDGGPWRLRLIGRLAGMAPMYRPKGE
jgi:GNAT superfamily N-acetyltransferase